VAVLLASSTAWGKPRVVILDFVGPQAAKATRAVEDAISKEVDLVPASDYVQAQKRLRIKKVTGENVARIAGEIQVDAVVSGKVAKKGKGLTLQLTVREGKSGETVDTLRVGLTSARLDAQAEEEIRAELLPSLAKIAPLSAPAAEDPVAKEDPSGKGPGEAEGAASSASEATAQGTYSAEELEERLYRDARGGISAGVLAFYRGLTFDHDLSAAEKPPNYSVPFIGAMLVDGEVYPLALSGMTGAASGIGVSFSLSRTLVMESSVENTDRTYSTTMSQWDVGLRYRWNFGSQPTQPTLNLGVSYGQQAFEIDTDGDVIDLPNVTTSYVDVGAGMRFPLGQPHLALSASGHYLQVLSSGDLSAADSYGGESVLGFLVDAGIEYRILRQYSLRVGGRFQRIAHTFDGSGAETTGRDADADQDVTGAVETYASGYATVGYLF
jgi:hypothetical protein